MKMADKRKAPPIQPHTRVNPGDVATSDGPGWWVCMKAHTTGSLAAPGELKPGQSNDLWHWATSPS